MTTTCSHRYTVFDQIAGGRPFLRCMQCGSTWDVDEPTPFDQRAEGARSVRASDEPRSGEEHSAQHPIGDAALRPPPYPFCRTPQLCAGKGYCPHDIACND